MNPAKWGKTPHWKFGEGSFARVHDELRLSVAYRCLTPQKRTILTDMIGEYQKKSFSGKNALPDGFRYPYLICKEIISDKSFYKAVTDIVEKGFFTCPPEIQDHRPASAYRYLPSNDWEKYKPSKEEQNKLDKFYRTKKDRLKTKAKRPDEFRSNYKPK